MPLAGILPSAITTQRPFTGTEQVVVGVELWVLLVPSLSSFRLGVTFVPVAGASVAIRRPLRRRRVIGRDVDGDVPDLARLEVLHPEADIAVAGATATKLRPPPIVRLRRAAGERAAPLALGQTLSRLRCVRPGVDRRRIRVRDLGRTERSSRPRRSARYRNPLPSFESTEKLIVASSDPDGARRAPDSHHRRRRCCCVLPNPRIAKPCQIRSCWPRRSGPCPRRASRREPPSSSARAA